MYAIFNPLQGGFVADLKTATGQQRVVRHGRCRAGQFSLGDVPAILRHSISRGPRGLFSDVGSRSHRRGVTHAIVSGRKCRVPSL